MQHDYHFDWHQRRSRALRPQRAGVLVLLERVTALGSDLNPTVKCAASG